MTSNKKMSPITWLILTLMGFYAGNIVSRPVRVSYIASRDALAAINASLEAYKNPVPSMNRIDLIAGAAIAAIVSWLCSTTTAGNTSQETVRNTAAPLGQAARTCDPTVTRTRVTHSS